MTKKPLHIGYTAGDFNQPQYMTLIVEDDPQARTDLFARLAKHIPDFQVSFYYVVNTPQNDNNS